MPRAVATGGLSQRLGAWWHGLSGRAKVWTGVAVVVAILVLAAIGGSSGSNDASSSPTATSAGIAAGDSPTGATSAAASATALPSGADVDDESASSAGALFAPKATGIPAPASGGSAADRLPGEPDPSLTPGALNPAVTQATIHSTICVSGWTATIRPSESFTNGLKVEQIGQYGYSDTSTSSYEEDHLISLELGGAPADARNLWPEPYTDSLSDGRPTGARTKDAFETKLKTEVCAGTITLAEGQSEIGDHWVHAYYAVALVTLPTNPATTAVPTVAAATEPPVVTQPAPPEATPTDPYAAAKAVGATAVCADGSLSFSKTRSGTCSKNGGVHWWTGNVGAEGPGAH